MQIAELLIWIKRCARPGAGTSWAAPLIRLGINYKSTGVHRESAPIEGRVLTVLRERQVIPQDALRVRSPHPARNALTE